MEVSFASQILGQMQFQKLLHPTCNSSATHLRHVTNGWSRNLATRVVGFVAKDAHKALLGLDAANHAPEHGGLAAPARPEQPVDGALWNGDVYIVQDGLLVLAAANVVAHIATLDCRAHARRGDDGGGGVRGRVGRGRGCE